MSNTRPDSSQVVFVPSGAGAVATDVQAQLRHLQSIIVNANDAPFYASPSASAAFNFTAIQAAIDSITEGEVTLTAGDYDLSDNLTIDKNNIHLIGIGTATLVVPPGTNTSTGFVLDIYDNVGIQPVNVALQNINVEISSNSGGNAGGIRWGASYSNTKNVNIRIKGDNMVGLQLTTDDAGTGPYYNVFDQPFVQGDSNSGTPLTGTKGVDFVSSTVTPSRSPNANTFIRPRAGGVYDGFDIKGAGNCLISPTTEAINRYHYLCDHPSVSSGSIRNSILNPYCEQYPTSTAFRTGTNASACVMLLPYYTGIGTLFSDVSTLKNNRLLDVETMPLVGAPVQRAAAKVTGTTVNRGFNVASVTTSGTGIFRVNFTNALDSVDYFVSCMTATNDATCRVSTYATTYVQFYFFDAAGAAINPTGFNVIVSR